MVSEN